MFLSFTPNAALRPLIGACALLLLLLGLGIAESQAALTLSSTRVVFDSDKRSASLVVANPSKQTFAAQAWVNTAADDTTTAVPFMPSPPLFRLDPGKEQQVQINGLPNLLPSDRESLFYFNVQEIPQVTAVEGNVLNIALRTRIKLFYRPSQLKGDPIARLPELQWSIERIDGKPHLVAHNPTPFHVSLIRQEINGQGQREDLPNPRMSLPLQRQVYPLNTIKPATGLRVTFAAVNDFGGISAPVTQPIQLAL